MPCSILVLPVLSDNTSTNKHNKNNTVDFISMPMVKDKSAYSEIMATAGMVSPILASAEPRERLKLFCSWFFPAVCTAAIPSGNNTIKSNDYARQTNGCSDGFNQVFQPWC